MTGWKSRSWRLTSILLLLVLAFALDGRRLLSRAWGNAGHAVLAQALVATPEAPVPPAAMAAETLLRRAVVYAPENRPAWRGLGIALVSQGREEEAIAAWKIAGEMDRELVERGELAHKARRYEEAIMWFERAAILAPDWALPWYYRGLAFEELEAWDEAFVSFQKAEERIDETEEISGSLYFHIGRLLQENLDPPDVSAALEYYQAALAANNFIHDRESIGAHYNRGTILYRTGRVLEAKQEFEWLVDNHPDDYRGHLWLGVVSWQANGDHKDAEKHFRKASELEPHKKHPYVWLGKYYEQTGNVTEAANAYERVLEIDPADKAALRFFDKLE